MPPPPRNEPSNGDVVQTAWPYAGLERDAEGIELEGGYLPAKCAASIKVLSETYPGHADNIFSKYIYAELLSTETRYGSRSLCLLLVVRVLGRWSMISIQNMARGSMEQWCKWWIGSQTSCCCKSSVEARSLSVSISATSLPHLNSPRPACENGCCWEDTRTSKVTDICLTWQCC